MKNSIALPKLNYIVFELVKVDVEDYLNEDYRAITEETIYLAVMPNDFSYRLAARDAITQTQKRVFINKYNYQPEKCSISGHFGYRPRLIAGTAMDGYSRLAQFENEIVRRSKENDFPSEPSKYVYALNYYDFWNHRFGNINIDSWRLNGNARRNTHLPFYNIEFIIMGDIIASETRDVILIGLKALFANGGLVDQGLDFVNDLLGQIEPITSIAGAGLESLRTANQLVGGAQSFLSGYSGLTNQSYSNVFGLFG